MSVQCLRRRPLLLVGQVYFANLMSQSFFFFKTNFCVLGGTSTWISTESVASFVVKAKTMIKVVYINF